MTFTDPSRVYDAIAEIERMADDREDPTNGDLFAAIDRARDLLRKAATAQVPLWDVTLATHSAGDQAIQFTTLYRDQAVKLAAALGLEPQEDEHLPALHVSPDVRVWAVYDGDTPAAAPSPGGQPDLRSVAS